MCNRLKVFCETMEKPIGVDNAAPRFSWRPDTEHVCRPQKAYQISVYEGGCRVWESGEVQSGASTMVPYRGEALRSFTEYRVAVISVLADGAVYRGEGSFETGILTQSEWRGDFLCYPRYEKRQAPVFVWQFRVGPDVSRVRAYFCGLGYGELSVNGCKADDSVLDPAWTNYNQRVLCRTLDVTRLVQTGDNKARILLGDGWMAHNHRYFRPKPPLPWYHEPCFLLNIRVTYRNGDVEILYPDEESCRANTSEILSQNLFDGEEYSAERADELQQQEAGELLEADGWIAPARTEIAGVRRSQLMQPIRETEVIEPVRIASIQASTYVVDMGVNFSGYARVTVAGEKGAGIRLRYSELANADDTVNQVNLRYAQCCDLYHLRGSGTEIYSPRFTYRGYRYLEIELIGQVRVLDVKGIRVHSAVERIGVFSCDHPLLNRIYRMLINTEINNMHSVPTDCPQRDERLGWMNDNTMRLEQNFMNFDSQLFYENWFQDILDEQKRCNTGAVPDTCPYYYGMSPARWNTSVFVMIPYFLYRYFGDTQVMERHWDALLWYMEYQKTKLGADGLIADDYVGEWCPPMKNSILEDRQSAFSKEISNSLQTSCFYYMECMLCLKMAELLGDHRAQKDFALRMKSMKAAINHRFFDEAAGYYRPLCQGNQILPLYLGLIPEGFDDRVRKHLTACIAERDRYHISTGSHTTRFLFAVLSMIGENDLAVRMLSETTYPSFGYMLENGATALWERWEKNLGFMTSHDHPMSGGFGVWFLQYLGGIGLGRYADAAPLRIAPVVPRQLRFVNSRRKCRTGEIVSNWYKTGDEIHFDFRIPWNLPVSIALPKLRCTRADLTINGKPAVDDPMLEETAAAFCREVGMGYWHMVLRPGAAAGN